ncbi:hypothetical protein [Micromonospora cathayae]|uniref:Resolvase/invertase-type recombinase catalytic domain-containing protein n=1 Tax=Micromonospora cathayae TaxID=3028804 RepID=A0ABY7ZMF7_9ACTN|nr:hypothetical protein [Micromonospora sp. HUAS 3]WDZ84043.1 hypothetical protein PVK37_26815 [Micromonospora sp. HUAS 3]
MRTSSVRTAGACPTDDMEDLVDVELLRGSCPACEVAIGETHADDCDVAECLATGRKRMWCRAQRDSAGHDCGRADWTGRWPGHAESREFGWHVRWDADAQRWERCSPDVEGSGPDLSRLYEHARWDSAARRWRRCRAVAFSRAMRGGRATIEELAKPVRRWCAEQGYELVGVHVGTRGWRETVHDLAAGRADMVAVPSVEQLGLASKQVFERIKAVHAAGGKVVGPHVRVNADGTVVESLIAGE